MGIEALHKLEAVVAELTSSGQPFELEDVEVRGVHYRHYKKQPDSLAQYFAVMARHDNKEFVVCQDERYTYGEAYQQASQFAHVLLQDYGVKPGDRVAIAMRNNPQWMFAFVAAASIGAIVVPMNAWWTGEELEYGLEDCGAHVVLVDPERAGRMETFVDRLKLQLVGVGDFSGLSLAVEDFAAASQRHIDATMPQVEIAPDADATIMYTSGSTGHPKGAVATHRSIIAAMYSWLLLGNAGNIVAEPSSEASPEDKTDTKFRPCALMTVPLFHATGSHSLFMLSVIIGRKIVMMHKWNVQEAMRLIEAERVTNFNGVPTMSAELQTAAQHSPYDLSSLKEIYSGGAARPPDQVKKITDTFKRSSPGSGYGLTETNALGAVNSGAFYAANPRSTGRTVPAVTDFQIVDDNDRPLPIGERGEVCIKSTANVRGYWNKPEATARAFKGEWFHSGDVGYMDEDGFLYIVDRIKEIIIRGGENISCIEVEAAIHLHDAVDEVAVFGLPDERLGEVVGAAVVVHEGMQLTDMELREYLAGHLAGFKIPQNIWVLREKLPRIASGKIFKRQLKADYTAQLQQ
ncbi:long-chain fatty acid--CoA ligase [Halieaceae bacterium IMCC14734]|uniref:Long-chain fatty acid--CoA ligase n=1 Tax=Candidatus Litorirhabdus singularis TaxID=2518993 RepID=A0ABT3TL77_9GAMM|nr:class I adenylate-forming enzyme family protein [Candidatus Litorirhabdus singularis]MCX2983016.1 long-chain fatty acid--CoA ligase [Candidatus Litorirhabdus singularis]